MDSPFQVDHYLNAISASAQRSRQVVLLLLFSAALIFMALINSTGQYLNWYNSTLTICKSMDNYIVFADEPKEGLSSISQYILKNERKYADSNVTITNTYADPSNIPNKYIKIELPDNTTRNVSCSDRLCEYDQISKSVKFANCYGIYSRAQLTELVKTLEEKKIDHIDFVNVPVLGITFDINYLSLYAGAILIILHYLLLYSLLSENANIVISLEYYVRNKPNHLYHFYEFMAMQQVFCRPKKLFKPYARIKGFFSLTVMVPLIVYTLVFFYDLLLFKQRYFINPTLTLSSIAVSGLFLFWIIVLMYRIKMRNDKMNVVWSGIASELNFEFVLNKIQLKDTGLGQLSNSSLTRENKKYIKLLWWNTVQKFNTLAPCNDTSVMRKFLKYCLGIQLEDKQVRYSRLLYEDFLNKALEIRNSIPTDSEISSEVSDGTIDELWSILMKWYDINLDKKLYRNIWQSLKDEVFAVIKSKEC